MIAEDFFNEKLHILDFLHRTGNLFTPHLEVCAGYWTEDSKT